MRELANENAFLKAQLGQGTGFLLEGESVSKASQCARPISVHGRPQVQIPYTRLSLEQAPFKGIVQVMPMPWGSWAGWFCKFGVSRS